MAVRSLTVLLLAFALAGCSSPPPPIVPVTGTIRLDGQPLPFVEVRFYPQEEGLKAEYISSAITDENGRFTLMTNNQPGGCACVNVVTVAEHTPDEARKDQREYEKYRAKLKNRPLPMKYANLAGNPLNATVTAGQSVYDFDLRRD